MPFLPGMYDKVERELLLALKCFQADLTDKWSIRIVTLLVTRQVVLALKGRIANVTNKPGSDR